MIENLIRDECNRLRDTLINKNQNYGNAVFRSQLFSSISPEEALWVRFGDKIRRLTALRGGEVDKVGESIRDTLMDVAGYAILLLIAPQVQAEEGEQDGSNKE